MCHIPRFEQATFSTCFEGHGVLIKLISEAVGSFMLTYGTFNSKSFSTCTERTFLNHNL